MAPMKKFRYQSVKTLSLAIDNPSPGEERRTIQEEEETIYDEHTESVEDNSRPDNNKENKEAKYDFEDNKQSFFAKYWKHGLVSIILLSIGFFLSKYNSSITEYSPSYASSQLAIEAQDLIATKYYAERGDVNAMAQLGDVYRWGLWNTKDSLPAALYWYAMAGDAGSQFKLGCINLIRNGDDTHKQAVE